MKRKILILSILAVLVFAAGAVLANGKVEAPVYLDGEFWVFRAEESNFISNRSNPLHGDYEVSYAAGEFKVSKINKDQRTSVSAEEEKELKLFFASPEKKERFLDFPLYVGQKWSDRYYRDSLSGFKAQWRNAESAVTEEKTIAGRKTLKISRKDTGAGPKLQIYSLWYDPGVKAIVKYEYDSSGGTGTGGRREIELIEHGRRHPDVASR